MPFISTAANADLSPNRFAAANTSDADIQRVTNMTNRQDHGFMATAAGVAGLGAVDLVDTISSSIPILSKAAGIQRGDFNSAALRALDMPGLTRFSQEYKGGIEATSGIAGIVAAELTVRRLSRPAGLLMSGLKALPFARRVASLDAEYATAMATVRQADRELAKRGAMGIEQYIGKVGVQEGGMGGLLGAAETGANLGRNQLRTKASGLAFLSGAKHAAATEAVMATTLNQNDFLYTDDMSHNLMWMALGVAGAGVFEKVAAGYQIRKYVNSDEVRRTFADALDPDGYEHARLLWKDNAGKKFGPNIDPKVAESEGFLGGKYTDYVTNLLVGSRSKQKTELGLSESGQALRRNRGDLASQELQMAREEMNKVTVKGITTNGDTRFDMTSKGYGNHVEQIMHRDPAAFMGAEMVGGVPETRLAEEVVTSHFNRLDERIAEARAAADEATANGGKTKAGKKFDMDANDGLLRRLDYEKKLNAQFYIDGEAATLTDAKVLDGWQEPNIYSNKVDDETELFESFSKDNKSHGVGVDTNLDLTLPGGKTMANADHYDVLRAYRTAGRVIQKLKNGVPEAISLPKDASFFQLDMAEQLIRESGGKVQVNFPNGLTRDQAMVESFAQKAQILRDETRKFQFKAVQEAKKGNDFDVATEISKLRVRLNMPKLTAYERGVLGESEHPLMRLLRGAAEFGPDEIRNMTRQDLMKAAAETKRIGDFAPSAASDFDDLTGNSFRYMLDESGNATKPLVVMKRNLQPHDWMPDNLADRLATQKMYATNQLMKPVTRKVGGQTVEVETLTNRLSKAIFGSEEFNTAARTSELMDTQIQGSLLGTANQSAAGGFFKSLKSRDWIGRDNPALLAASRVQEMVQRVTRDMFQTEAKGLQEVAGVLNSPRNASTKMLLNQFIAYRPGWELAIDKRKALMDSLGQLTLPNGKPGYKFILQNTEGNKNRWRQMFNEEMPQNAVMPTPDGRDMVLDDMGLDFMQRFNAMTDSLMDNKNQLLKANGLQGIEKMDFYVPPANIDGKFIGFTLDAENKVVPGMTVIANTPEEFARQQEKITGLIESEGKYGHRFVTRDQIKRFANIWDDAQMDMIDPGTTAIQPGKRAGGGLAGVTIDPQGVDGILSTLRSQYFRHSNDVVGTMFREQIRSATARAEVSSGVTRNKAGFFRDDKNRSIHDYYLENLLGRSPLDSPGSMVGRLYNTIEGNIDKFLAQGAPSVSRTWHATNAYLDRIKPWDKSGVAKRDFESLTNALGEHMPFKNAAEMLESQGAGSMPPQLKDAMGAMNRFTAATMLRVFEPMMAVMNLAGVVNAMPAVIRSMAQREGETAAEFAARLGHIGSIFPDVGREGQSVGVLDMSKVMGKAFKRAWSKESHVDYDFMRRNGYLSQEVAEFQKQFGAIETKADWQRAMFGDKANPTKVFGEKGLLGHVSILTDKSEDFSRSWGHMAGLEVANHLGVTGLEARNMFAHDFANKMIANYNPLNRPEVFQGALGAPIGLFQSFIMQYYQRLFRYAETKDFASLGVQYATQGSLFGVTTVPGWSEMNKLFFDHSKGDIDPQDSIREKYGQAAGDIIANGTLGNIPKLFGLPGMDLSSRGDTAVKVPGFGSGEFSITNLPAFNAAGKVITGVAQGLKALTSSPALTMQQLAEIAGNTIPNRPIAGLIEQVFQGGDDVDAIGQIASETQGYAEGAYRMMGVRSLRQSQELNAFYANRSQMELKASADDNLRTATRSAIRGENYDVLPDLFAKYVENGHDPRHFKRWLKGNYEAATETRGTRQLDEMLKNPEKMGYVARLLDAGVSIGSDENTEDYATSLDQPSNFDSVNTDMPDYGTAGTANMTQDQLVQ